MSRKQEIFEGVLKKAYVHDDFVGFTREFLNDIQLVAPTKYNKEYSNFSFYVDGYYHIGNYKTDDGDVIAVLSVNLHKGETVERARSMQRNFVKTLMERNGCAGAIVAFYTSEEPDKWRLSFIRMDYEFSKGKVDQKLTPAKRYSYLVGEKEPCTTALQRLFPIFDEDNERPNIDEIEDAFSVEKVTKEFFDKYVEKYLDLKDYLESNEDFMIEAKTRGFSSEQFAKKLLGQIVFLYFIQKKGWLGVSAIPTSLPEKKYNNAFYAKGNKSREIIPKVYKKVDADKYRIDVDALRSLSDDEEEILAACVKGEPWGSGPRDFMRQIFKGCSDAGKNFFDDYLEPLFYTGLNLNRGENGFYAPLHRRIPFLNGGLFEQLDNYDWENNDFNIPNDIFSNVDEKGRDADGILDIFDRYNFTMNEDEPMEREVAIDPEMLGKVFENLLDVKDRKDKGAFYTPRAVVHYMCQETLINYLVNKTGISESAIRAFILYGEYFKDEDTEKTKKVTDNGNPHYEIDKDKPLYISDEIFSFKKNVNRLQELDELLKNVKVADLAVGSGAFPLGMLNEIVKARNTLTAYLSIGMNNFEKKSFIAYGRKLYDLKMETIKNCIFACDIEASAVDIAKLRLWLSIVIDDEITENAGNGEFDAHTKPRQLPNLDCNIICGNSLVDEFHGTKLITKSSVLGNDSEYQYNIFNYSGVDSLISRLIELQEKLFYVKDHNDKEDIKQQIQTIYDQIIKEQIYTVPGLTEKYNITINEPSKPFILWQLYFPKVFKDNGGFDIVIGNPPYLKERDYKDIFATIYATSFGDKYGEGKMNFWYFFFHKGMDLLSKNGALSFIAPNYFVAGAGASKINNRLINDCTMKLFVDFNKTKVFEKADVQTMILLAENKKPEEADNIRVYKFLKKVPRDEIDDVITSIEVSPIISRFIVDDQHCILSADGKINFENATFADILNKIESKKSSTDLFKSTQGIVENPSFLNKKNIENIASMGVDVSQYAINDEVFVINKENIDNYNFTDKEKSFLREYHDPSEVHRYYCTDEFEKYLLYLCKDNVSDIDEYPNIKQHLEKYRPFMDVRRETQKGSNMWYHLHWPRKEELFAGEKIVYPQMGERPTFAYSSKPYFTNMSANIVYAKADINLKVFTCVLNSSLAHFWFLNRAKNRGIGLDIAVTVVDKFPIDESILNDEMLTSLSEEIISSAEQEEDYTELENKVNQQVYRLYGISEDEKEIMEKYIAERTEKNNG